MTDQVHERIRIKSLRTYIQCNECGHIKKKMTYIQLVLRPQEHCKYCAAATFWTPKYHEVVYEEVEDEDRDN